MPIELMQAPVAIFGLMMVSFMLILGPLAISDAIRDRRGS